MSETQTRLDVMTAIDAIVNAWTDYTLVVDAPDRQVVDQSTQTNPYLQVDIDPLSARQMDLADRPKVEQLGQILLYVVSKEGSGTVAPNKLVDFIRPYFDMKSFTLIQTKAAEAHKPKYHHGWRYAPILVNYYYHRVST